ncbi:MAG: aminotransferase class V-fold PLP-dependent enzyme [Candidatus Latescibacteria bacterium]|nr:aminotransferase class V-fold PLP-dependent enzyme [Candidatus Latescibacterota bacterium]
MKKPQEELAIDGGPKAFAGRTGVPQPKIGVAEFLSVAERFGFKPAVLSRLRRTLSDADLLGQGPNLARYATAFPPATKSDAFEALARKKFGVKYALAVNSGTSALHAAFVAAGVGPGTEVICPALGFAATAMAVVVAGGVPVFCDVDESLGIDPAKIAACITPRTVAVAPTHHWGNVADMAGVMKVARRHKLKVIEDCAQGPGAKYAGAYVGGIGDIGCFSISAYKIIGGGEGGLVVTNNERLFDRIRQMAEAGGLWRPDRFGPPRYKGELFAGCNYRLSELEAAVDLIQLRKLDQICNRFRKVSRRVRRQLHTYAEINPQTVVDTRGYLGYMLRFFPATCALSAKLTAALRAEGVPAHTRGRKHRPDWHLYRDMFPVVLKGGHTPEGSVFKDPRYLKRGGKVEYRGACPVAEDLYSREVTVWLDQWLSDTDADALGLAIDKVLGAYCTRDPNAKPWG